MSRNKLLSVFLLATVLLTSCSVTENKQSDEKPLTNAWSTVEESVINNEDTNAVTEKTEKPLVLISGASNEIKDAMKESEQWMSFLDDDSEITTKLSALMEKELGSIAEWLAPNGEPIIVKVWKYAPVFVFDTEVEVFDYEKIKSENSDLIYDIELESWKKYFAFKDPSLLGAGKESVTMDNEWSEFILNNALSVVDSKEGNKTVILVEDPLCPNCAVSWESENTKQILENYNTKILWLPLPIQWHENSKKIIDFMYGNTNNGILDKELVSAILSKQKELSVLDIEDGSKIIKILETTGYDTSKLKTVDFENSSYNNIEAQKAASWLGVSWTPTTYYNEWETFTYFENVTELENK